MEVARMLNHPQNHFKGKQVGNRSCPCFQDKCCMGKDMNSCMGQCDKYKAYLRSNDKHCRGFDFETDKERMKLIQRNRKRQILYFIDCKRVSKDDFIKELKIESVKDTISALYDTNHTYMINGKLYKVEIK